MYPSCAALPCTQPPAAVRPPSPSADPGSKRKREETASAAEAADEPAPKLPRNAVTGAPYCAGDVKPWYRPRAATTPREMWEDTVPVTVGQIATRVAILSQAFPEVAPHLEQLAGALVTAERVFASDGLIDPVELWGAKKASVWNQYRTEMRGMLMCLRLNTQCHLSRAKDAKLARDRLAKAGGWEAWHQHM